MARGNEPVGDDAARAALTTQLRDAYGRVTYTFKTHYKAADAITKQFGRLQLAQVILSSLTTAGIVAIFFDETSLAAKAFSGLMASALTVLTFYLKSGKHAELAQQHVDAANKLWIVRERYISLLTDLTTGTRTVEEGGKARDKLFDQQAEIQNSLPQTNNDHYEAAQEALKKNEEMYFSEPELDRILPPHLRRGKKSGDGKADKRKGTAGSENASELGTASKAPELPAGDAPPELAAGGKSPEAASVGPVIGRNKKPT